VQPARGIIQSLIICLAVLAGSPFMVAAQDQADARLRIELNIPDRTVMYFSGPPAGATGSFSNPGAQGSVIFDLNCATLGELSGHCSRLYGGPLLDTFGRPYPPVRVDAAGRFISSDSFPQYFESRARTLRFFLPDDSWRLQVELLGMQGFSADHFAIWTDHGHWRCLGWHEDWLEHLRGWMEPAACPADADAARHVVTLAEARENPGGWQELLIRLMLRIDGSEPSGSYSGVLRYTLVSF
jgi:hypothetical protein